MKKSHFLTLLALLGTAFAEQVTILGINDMILSNCGAGEDSREFLEQQGEKTSQP